MRRLIIILIVHSSPDMGSMKDDLERESIAKIGKHRWDENKKRIENFWNEVEKEIDLLGLDYIDVRLYQDGMPCGGVQGERIVREVAAKGSRNYQIVKTLIEKGATLEATENPEMLIKEYECIKRIIEAKTEEERTEAKLLYDKIKDRLIEDRDTFIATAIDSTLKDGETGLLFIGAAHDVASKLPDHIEVKRLD
ncbi:MAG TPA: hypothetical protein HA349_09925 [Methanotrichaceae archaeon]|nr:hypothetical protein [Methanotrichaceae archaeon]